MPCWYRNDTPRSETESQTLTWSHSLCFIVVSRYSKAAPLPPTNETAAPLRCPILRNTDGPGCVQQSLASVWLSRIETWFGPVSSVCVLLGGGLERISGSVYHPVQCNTEEKPPTSSWCTA